jgi:hypothetical protein
MFSFISSILGLLPTLSNTINSITNAIANAKIAQINATDDEERTRAGERVASLEATRDVLVAEAAHSNLDVWVRFLLTIGPAIWVTKIFTWDAAFHLGTTDAVSPDLVTLMQWVFGFYFLHAGATSVARILKS